MSKTKVTGRVKLLKALLYNSHMIYIRMIGKDYIEYLLEYKGEIYSGYNIMLLNEGRSKLSKKDISLFSDMTMAMAQTTLDALLGIKMDSNTEKMAKVFEEGRKKLEGKKNATSI
jgi:hypothetical protein